MNERPTTEVMTVAVADFRMATQLGWICPELKNSELSLNVTNIADKQ
ncbi:hypothetical protein [Alcaligenes faecalis]|nr:hypothetical protein [Alcaligenes faecalis]